jgi:hypothetical protein
MCVAIVLAKFVVKKALSRWFLKNQRLSAFVRSKRRLPSLPADVTEEF